MSHNSCTPPRLWLGSGLTSYCCRLLFVRRDFGLFSDLGQGLLEIIHSSLNIGKVKENMQGKIAEYWEFNNCRIAPLVTWDAFKATIRGDCLCH